MSRTQWCCLVAVLAVVLGLFRGPATTVAAATVAADAAPVRGISTMVAAAASDRNDRNSWNDRNRASGKSTGIPGCDRDQDGGAPGAPARSRVAHDHVPGPAGWGLPAVTGRGPAHPLLRPAARGAEPATFGPVELAVLRV